MSNNFSDKFWVVIVIFIGCGLLAARIIDTYDIILLFSLNQIFIKLCEINNKHL